MTREQAIEHGKSQLEVFGGEHREFIELAIKALKQEPTTKIEESNFSQEQYLVDIQSAYDCGKSVIDKIRAEIVKYEGDCRLSVDEYPSCKQCTDNVFETIYGILDKCKAETEET